MSFRNISRRQDYKVLRTRPAKPTDEKMWHNIYPPQVQLAFKNIQKFTVANWVPIVVGIVAALGGLAGGFYVGQVFSTANISQKFAKGAVDLLPKKLQSNVREFFKELL
jgi:hypothetical protein